MKKIVSSEQQMMILAALQGRELYGLEIQELITGVVGEERTISLGSLYPTLRRLEKRGYLSSRWGEERFAIRGGARRRYYIATEDGQKVFQEGMDIYRRLEQA